MSRIASCRRRPARPLRAARAFAGTGLACHLRYEGRARARRHAHTPALARTHTGGPRLAMGGVAGGPDRRHGPRLLPAQPRRCPATPVTSRRRAPRSHAIKRAARARERRRPPRAAARICAEGCGPVRARARSRRGAVRVEWAAWEVWWWGGQTGARRRAAPCGPHPRSGSCGGGEKKQRKALC